VGISCGTFEILDGCLGRKVARGSRSLCKSIQGPYQRESRHGQGSTSPRRGAGLKPGVTRAIKSLRKEPTGRHRMKTGNLARGKIGGHKGSLSKINTKRGFGRGRGGGENTKKDLQRQPKSPSDKEDLDKGRRGLVVLQKRRREVRERNLSRRRVDLRHVWQRVRPAGKIFKGGEVIRHEEPRREGEHRQKLQGLARAILLLVNTREKGVNYLNGQTEEGGKKRRGPGRTKCQGTEFNVK